MADINASITDGTGKEIVEALRGLGGGSSSGGDVVVLKTLPPVNPDAGIRLNLTGNEILEAASGDKVVMLCVHNGEPANVQQQMTCMSYILSSISLRESTANDTDLIYVFTFDVIGKASSDAVTFVCYNDLDTYPEYTDEIMQDMH